MPVHPDTNDGYFVSGDPLTGNRPAGAFPSLDFFNALLDLLDAAVGGVPETIAAETTLAAESLIFGNPAEGEVLLIHLPVYASVSAAKRYEFKNIGQGVISLDCSDGKLIDGLAALPDLLPGDRCRIAKDGANWQTIS